MELVLNAPTLCLNMIVKNEEKVITRLFDSVLPIIDCYCICDTGSTDNTIKIIEDYFKNKNIPGKIVIKPFVNFCHNRTFALKECVGMSDYVLLLDADMVLEIKNFNKQILTSSDSFYILQGNDSFYYQNMRIVKNNGLYHYIGVTHEYIDIPPNSSIVGFSKNDLFIRDFGDGGCKNDKFERDIRLLLDGIKEEPNNPRYYFYLGNSYSDVGRYGEAINCYKKRIDLKGWREEVWYSYYKIGCCFKHLNKINDAIKYWMEGYEYYPERLEGLYEIINYCRIHSKHKIGNMIYCEARKILDKKFNREQYLFLHNEIYTSKIFYEYTIIANYLGVTNINYEAIQVFNNSNDGNEISNLLQNLKYYKDILTPITKVNVDNKINTIINNENIEMISSSSCLIKNKHNDNYGMNIRFVNYKIDNNGNYHNCDKHIITVNKYIEVDKNFNLVNEKWLDLIFDGRRYIGIEDIRIFNDVQTNKLLFIGTALHQSNRIGMVSGLYDIVKGCLNGSEITQLFNRSDCEKNWVYVDYNNETHIIYNWHPIVICNIKDNTLNIISKKETPKIFSRIRGSTCGFKYSTRIRENTLHNGNIKIDIVEDEIWFINHMVSHETPRHYYHVISVFDKNMNLLRYSAPFKFEGEPIEYCLSIVVEHDIVIINYSTWDRTTRIGIYDKKYIDSILKYNN